MQILQPRGYVKHSKQHEAPGMLSTSKPCGWQPCSGDFSSDCRVEDLSPKKSAKQRSALRSEHCTPSMPHTHLMRISS